MRQTCAIETVFFQSVANLVHDVVNRNCPINLREMFVSVRHSHRYNTRSSAADKLYTQPARLNIQLKVAVQFEQCFRLMEHISVVSCCNPRNLYITEKLNKFSKSLFYFYLVISNK